MDWESHKRRIEMASALKRLVVRRCLHQISDMEFDEARAEIIGRWLDSSGFKERRHNLGSQVSLPHPRTVEA